MMSKNKRPYAEMIKVANEVLEELRPHCNRIEIAGSLRRKCEMIGDIEIVAIPKPYQTGLFEDGLAEVVNKWEKVKGEMNYGQTKYTQRKLKDGIILDLFFAEHGNWGSILAIRTGSSDYSRNVLASAWAARGYKSEGGYLISQEKRYEVREEKDLFERIGLKYEEPENRNLKLPTPNKSTWNTGS
jgi:DNA polymerase/3'-5' exonuclease PolX